MNEGSPRPFYAEYAWAFDLLIDRPVRKECDVMVSWLIDLGILPGSSIIDAGCGTGRYAMELARRGYVVHGVDLSPDLIDVAMCATGDSVNDVSFSVGDIAHLPASRCAAILCRGVLNDIIDDAGRDAVLAAFAEALQSNGVLILDVRDWAASVERKTREPLFRKRVSTERGELTFTSVTALDTEQRRLLISERHELIERDETRVSDYQFVMRCWDRAELNALLARYGFRDASWFGAYDPGVPIGATDRLVVVAQRVRLRPNIRLQPTAAGAIMRRRG
jgi:SAM-dependent methyltransferase